MKSIIIRTHLGLGDQLICNAIFRWYAELYDRVILPCKLHNAPTIQAMVQDVEEIKVIGVLNDEEADRFYSICKLVGVAGLGLGCGRLIAGGDPMFDMANFDREFYRIAGVKFDDRWEKFTWGRKACREIGTTATRYQLVHEDPARGYTLRPELLNPDLEIVRIEPRPGNTLFDWVSLMEGAAEIHMIDSAPALLVDSLRKLKAKKLVMHWYARPSEPHPMLWKLWKIEV